MLLKQVWKRYCSTVKVLDVLNLVCALKLFFFCLKKKEKRTKSGWDCLRKEMGGKKSGSIWLKMQYALSSSQNLLAEFAWMVYGNYFLNSADMFYTAWMELQYVWAYYCTVKLSVASKSIRKLYKTLICIKVKIKLITYLINCSDYSNSLRMC